MLCQVTDNEIGQELMMLRLIYGCGLRISEAIKLRVGDVDLQTGVLLIRAAKFNKDRYVPMAHRKAL